jgi:hypothetical protein
MKLAALIGGCFLVSGAMRTHGHDFISGVVMCWGVLCLAYSVRSK